MPLRSLEWKTNKAHDFLRKQIDRPTNSDAHPKSLISPPLWTRESRKKMATLRLGSYRTWKISLEKMLNPSAESLSQEDSAEMAPSWIEPAARSAFMLL